MILRWGVCWLWSSGLEGLCLSGTGSTSMTLFLHCNRRNRSLQSGQLFLVYIKAKILLPIFWCTEGRRGVSIRRESTEWMFFYIGGPFEADGAWWFFGSCFLWSVWHEYNYYKLLLRFALKRAQKIFFSAKSSSPTLLSVVRISLRVKMAISFL